MCYNAWGKQEDTHVKQLEQRMYMGMCKTSTFPWQHLPQSIICVYLFGYSNRLQVTWKQGLDLCYSLLYLQYQAQSQGHGSSSICDELMNEIGQEQRRFRQGIALNFKTYSHSNVILHNSICNLGKQGATVDRRSKRLKNEVLKM